MPLFRHRSPAPAPASPPPTTTQSSPRRSRSLFARRRSSASSVSSLNSDTRDRSQPRRKGLFGMGSGSRKSDPGIDKDPSVLAARERLATARKAEEDADRALALARRAVIEARDHCKQLETQAIDEARLAKAKRTEARGLGKQARGLGRHN